MRTITHTTLAAVVLSVLLAGVSAQTTTAPAAMSLPPEATTAHTQVIRDLATLIGNDVTALKAAVVTLETDKAAGLSVAANVTAVEAARAQLRTDQQALSDAAKAYFSAARVSIHADQVQLNSDVTAALKTPTITADKAAVDAAEAKVRLDIAFNDTAALAVDQAALDAARRQLVTDRSAALASSLALSADRIALAAAR
jgi:hypothetical protein